MGADLRLSGAQNARAAFLQLVTGGEDVLDLVADVMDAARGVLFEKALDRAVIPQRIQKLDLGVGQFDEDHGHAVIGFVLRRADRGAKGAAILLGRGVEIRHGDGKVVQASDHGLVLRYRYGMLWGYMTRGASDRGTQP